MAVRRSALSGFPARESVNRALSEPNPPVTRPEVLPISQNHHGYLQRLHEIRFRELPHRSRPALSWGQDKPTSGGVYAFWWRGNARQFLRSIRNRRLYFLGPNRSTIELHITLRLLRTAKNGFLPLYIGKTGGSITKRVGLHLKLGTARTVSRPNAFRASKRKTTSCQVRDRLDRLFPYDRDTRNLAIDNLMLSYVELDDFYDRFCLENLAIGALRTIFNVDSER